MNDPLELKSLIVYIAKSFCYFFGVVFIFRYVTLLSPESTLQDALPRTIEAFVISSILGVGFGYIIWAVKGIDKKIIIRSAMASVLVGTLMIYTLYKYAQNIFS